MKDTVGVNDAVIVIFWHRRIKEGEEMAVDGGNHGKEKGGADEKRVRRIAMIIAVRC